ncbi:HET domain-containing protein [Stagonosporopsis vannaccii]|nr:HET domain-containing protein [Stagonosporopsis vannaccii]
MEDKQSLHYDPLPSDGASFRLLRVLPSLKTHAEIQCELFATSITSSTRKYVAGSYVWGAPQPGSHITVNGVKIQVRENLADFLRGCRGRATALNIWIDAICINQSDLAERSSQVCLMSQIYTNATATYCWLGSDANVINALKIIERFNVPGSDFTDENVSFKIGTIEYYPVVALRGACVTLVECEYWRRSWIVQEFVLASRISLLAGRTCISGYYREYISKILRTLGEETKVDSRRLAHVRRLHTMHESYHRGIRFDLEQLFRTFSSSECAVPRDRLFSTFGLLTPEATMSLRPSISYSVSGWSILLQVLESGIVLDYPRFTDLFSDKVLQREQHPVLTADIQIPFLFSLQIPKHCTSACPNHKLGPRSDTIVSCWWLEYLARPYEMVILSTQEVSGKHANGRKLYTCGLIASCGSKCDKKCSGHPIDGVAFLWEATLYDRELRSSRRVFKLAWAHTLESGQADFEKRSDFHLNSLEPRTLSERLRPYRDPVVMKRGSSTRYSMATDLQTFVRLSHFIMDLDRAFETIPNCAFRP